ncbi:hypothetical protein CRUP_007777, partial [Coryphaenoides rupestris]
MDGSSSLRLGDFQLAKRWLVNITNSFDISSRHTQTGRAIKFATQHVFASSNRTRTARNRIGVVLTDGRSQDDVVDAAKEAKVQGSIMFQAAYQLNTKLDFTDSTRSILPEGLPRAYVFVTTLRLRSPTHKMKLDLLRVVSQDGLPQMAVTLNGVEKAVIFTTTATSISKKEQSIVFNSKGIQRLFDTDWHQLKLLVRSGRVTSYLDGVEVGEQLLGTVSPIYIDGKIQVAKKVKMEVTV